jgi:hypothetical protein
LSPGAVQEITDWRSSYEDADTRVGESGTVAGTAAADAADRSEVPEMFVAITLNVYEVPLVRPVITQLVAPVVVQDFPPGVEIAKYCVITAPLLEGAVQETVDSVDS